MEETREGSGEGSGEVPREVPAPPDPAVRMRDLLLRAELAVEAAPEEARQLVMEAARFGAEHQLTDGVAWAAEILARVALATEADAPALEMLVRSGSAYLAEGDE